MSLHWTVIWERATFYFCSSSTCMSEWVHMVKWHIAFLLVTHVSEQDSTYQFLLEEIPLRQHLATCQLVCSIKHGVTVSNNLSVQIQRLLHIREFPPSQFISIPFSGALPGEALGAWTLAIFSKKMKVPFLQRLLYINKGVFFIFKRHGPKNCVGLGSRLLNGPRPPATVGAL